MLALFLLSCYPTSTVQNPPPVPPPADGLDSLAIWTAPGESRPFLLANRTGTYFYGATGKQWDSGWMGLWVHRQRVLKSISFHDADGTPLNLDSAWCRVTPADVTWIWSETPRKDLTLFFTTRQDSLYYSSESGINVDGSEWIYPAPRPAATPLRKELLTELHNLHFSCADTVYSRAVAWANLQLLFLLAEDDSLLYAGIPWFNEGWGRDTFISLSGLLVTGHTDAARKLLSRFAGWVDRDSSSSTFGRVPNRVRPGEEIAYNTADGTPWWIRELYEYGLYSRDYKFWEEMLKDSGAVRVALKGAVARSDSLGFLHHPNEDTWMDAVAPDGVVTPRGDRAVDIEALHATSFDAADRMAAACAGTVPSGVRMTWQKKHDSIRRNFLPLFLAPSQDRLWDRIMSNDRPDTVTRPNQLFALTVPFEPLVPPTIESSIVRYVSRELIEPHGVLSLSPRDTAFHPYHMDSHYPKDDAYHQGIVWVWLSGPAKTALRREGRADLALELANYEARLMHERGLVGSLPELLDAKTRMGNTEPNCSGTTTQAWSLAEFLRTTYQDFLGIRPVFVKGRIEPFWLIDPRIPEEWGKVTARIFLEQTPLFLTLQNFGDSMSVTILPEVEPAKPIAIKLFDELQGITGYLNVAEPVEFVYRRSDSTAAVGGIPTAQVKLHGWPYDKGPRDIQFAKPITREDFASLKDPDWDILTAKDALARNSASNLLWETNDPAQDDTGYGGYEYPTDEHFLPGILDITKFEVREDQQSYFFDLTFRKLVQPGWHPEYGFQLTYAAICLHDGMGVRTSIDSNSGFTFDKKDALSRLILVGGGFRIENDSSRVLAQFTPASQSEAFGDTTSNRISFSLPKKYFPERNDNWRWSVLVGAQDDHGGAGMGEFRAVKPIVEKWAGGGNKSNQPNIYDVLYSDDIKR
jgi:glycogen debranching enzyme